MIILVRREKLLRTNIIIEIKAFSSMIILVRRSFSLRISSLRWTLFKRASSCARTHPLPRSRFSLPSSSLRLPAPITPLGVSHALSPSLIRLNNKTTPVDSYFHYVQEDQKWISVTIRELLAVQVKCERGMHQTQHQIAPHELGTIHNCAPTGRVVAHDSSVCREKSTFMNMNVLTSNSPCQMCNNVQFIMFNSGLTFPHGSTFWTCRISSRYWRHPHPCAPFVLNKQRIMSRGAQSKPDISLIHSTYKNKNIWVLVLLHVPHTNVQRESLFHYSRVRPENNFKSDR